MNSGEDFGLCDCLQEPRQCGEVTGDGEPNAIPINSASVRRCLPRGRVALADAAFALPVGLQARAPVLANRAVEFAWVARCRGPRWVGLAWMSFRMPLLRAAD